MIVFQCSNCDESDPCVLIIRDAEVPEYCPWTGRKDECDWNAMRVDELLNCSCGTAPKLGNTHQWFFVQCPKCHARTRVWERMIVFQCSNCDESDPCVLIIRDAEVPEYCPWTGRKDECDWNAMRVIP